MTTGRPASVAGEVAAANERDPLRELAQAVLENRVYISGEDWENRDGEHRWFFEIKVSEVAS